MAVGPEGGEARVLESRGDGGAFAMAEELVLRRGGCVSGVVGDETRGFADGR